MRRSVSKVASKTALRKEVRKRGRRSSNLLGLKKKFLWTKKKIKERAKVKLKKNARRKRTTEDICSGSSFKTTNPNPVKEIKVKIKIGSKNFGIC